MPPNGSSASGRTGSSALSNSTSTSPSCSTSTRKRRRKMTTTNRAKLTMPSDTELVITREFNAPRDIVFEALSKPGHVKRWYGLRHLTLPVCEMDFRVGGKWRFVLRDPNEGVDHAFSGEYREIVRPERIVQTEWYEAIPGAEYVAPVPLT